MCNQNHTKFQNGDRSDITLSREKVSENGTIEEKLQTKIWRYYQLDVGQGRTNFTT